MDIVPQEIFFGVVNNTKMASAPTCDNKVTPVTRHVGAETFNSSKVLDYF
jgi:hypothetical protein